MCLEARETIAPDYGYQIRNTFDLTKAIYRYGSGLRQNLDHGEIKRLPIFLPSLDEQAAIVRFLDHANRKIDGFIRAKRKLIGLLNEQKQASYRVEKKQAIQLAATDADAEIAPVPVEGGGRKPESQLDRLSAILAAFNEQFGTLFQDSDRILRRIKDDIAPQVAADQAYRNARENTPAAARMEHEKALSRVMLTLLKDDTEVYKQFVENRGGALRNTRWRVCSPWSASWLPNPQRHWTKVSAPPDGSPSTKSRIIQRQSGLTHGRVSREEPSGDMISGSPGRAKAGMFFIYRPICPAHCQARRPALPSGRAWQVAFHSIPSTRPSGTPWPRSTARS